VLKKDGSMLNRDKGVCLDMTYFCIDGVHYAAWSSRDVDPLGDGRNEYGTNGPADIFIATIDPGAPWRLSSDPVCICRPVYGWERVETEVVEGPFLLRRGNDLFMTFSGASVGVVYAVGLLRAAYGSDLLNPASWDALPYPILTSAGFPGQYGPGHNNFFKDPGNPDDDMIALLYRPGPEWTPGESGQEERNPRHAAVRRVHWNASGLPNLEMTPGRDLDPAFAGVKLTITIED
jgi:GH43 family beta-xylosidase